MYADFRVKIWGRITFEDKYKDEVAKAFERGEITSANELAVYLEDRNIGWSSEFIYETEEEMTVEENSGDSTVEIWEEGGKTLFKNGK